MDYVEYLHKRLDTRRRCAALEIGGQRTVAHIRCGSLGRTKTPNNLIKIMTSTIFLVPILALPARVRVEFLHDFGFYGLGLY